MLNCGIPRDFTGRNMLSILSVVKVIFGVFDL